LDSEVAADTIVGAAGEEVVDLWSGGLAVAINTAISLLKGEERPRNIEVEETVGLVVEVNALRGDVGADEDTEGGAGAAEVLDNGVLVVVGEATVKGDDFGLLQLQVTAKVMGEPWWRCAP